MKTYVSKKTGARYPENGCFGAFIHKGDNGYSRNDIFIKPGYPDFIEGRKNHNFKNFLEEEIPDLVKPFTDDQWRAYAVQYGDIVASEFLDCCDYSKPWEARRLTHPPKNEAIYRDSDVWFKATFKQSVHSFVCAQLLLTANVYSLDIIKFEKYLACEFGYPMHEDISMSDFMTRKFGAEVVARFRTLIPEV